MTNERVYLSTTIPYVNARPHLGHALELVQADVLARHHRLAGDQVRFQTGTDDNSLKNVLAAEAEGRRRRRAGGPQRRGVRGAARAARAVLRRLHPHQQRSAAPARVWNGSGGPARPAVICTASDYEGLYCVGCEQFYRPAELPDGLCPEHGTRAGASRGGELVLPAVPLRRPAARPDQLGQAPDRARRAAQRGARLHRRRPRGLQRVALHGAGPRLGHPRTRRSRPGDLRLVGRARQLHHRARLRHRRRRGLPALVDRRRPPGAPGRQGRAAVPRRLLAGDPALGRRAAAHRHPGARLPDDRRQQDQQVGRAAGTAPTPWRWPHRYGTDAVRWWLLREVPRVGDADFTAARLVARANDDLANDLGNLVSRVVTLVHRYRQGKVPRGHRWRAAGGQARRRLRRPGARWLQARRPDPATSSGGAGRLRLPRRHRRDLGGGRGGEPLRGAGRALAAGPGRTRRRRRRWRAAGRVAGAAHRHLLASWAGSWRRSCPALRPGSGPPCDDSAGPLPAAEPVFPRLEAASVGAAV